MGRPATLPTIAAACPDLALDWHPANTRTPDTTSIGAKYRALWKCRNTITVDGRPRPCGHEWTNMVANRARAGQGCPACAGKAASDWNNLAITRPDLVAEWSPANDRAPHEVPSGSAYKAAWICATCSHEWQKNVEKRANGGYGCPACSKSGPGVNTTNNLAALRPDLVRDWHPRNAQQPTDLRAKSNVTVWWLCHNPIEVGGETRECGYEWASPLSHRNRLGCPACAGYAVTDWNNLAVTHPHLVDDWDTANALQAHEVTHGSHKKVWWTCRNPLPRPVNGRTTCGYKYRTAVFNRANGKGCPACAGQHLTPWNNLGALYPELVGEWSPNNAKTPFEVPVGSMYRPEWVCSISVKVDDDTITCGHRWKTRAANRAHLGTGCPACTTNATSKAEVYLAHEVAVFHETRSGAHRVEGATQRWQVDIELPDHRILVEYDGAHWHRDHLERDLRKNADLEAAGWTVVRVREHPLPLTSPHDVPCTPFSHKDTAVAVLRRIAALTGSPMRIVDDYAQSPDLKNRAAADAALLSLRMRDLERRQRRLKTRSEDEAEAQPVAP